MPSARRTSTSQLNVLLKFTSNFYIGAEYAKVGHRI